MSGAGRRTHTLLVDNYDSFTYNLFQLIGSVNRYPPTVIRNDELDPELLDVSVFDNIVISPGPGRPDVARDFGLSRYLVEHAELPLLGVCLGHQGIVLGAGGSVVSAPAPRHGFPDLIHHDGQDLFEGLPDDFTAVRYHSLCAATPLPEALEVTATAPDGVIMGVRHRTRPQWGVQFHPESVCSEHGATLMRNFTRLSERFAAERDGPAAAGPRESIGAGPQERCATGPGWRDDRTKHVLAVAISGPVSSEDRSIRRFDVVHQVVEHAVDTEVAFARLHGHAETAFWLDSALAEAGAGRFSYLGDASGPAAEVIRYRVGDGHVRVRTGEGECSAPGTVLDYLAAELDRRRIEFPDVPFDFAGGYVGYLGYEMKADCGGAAAHRSPTDDAVWVFADRLVVVDHHESRTHLIALSEPESAAAQHRWMSETRAVLECHADRPDRSSPPPDPGWTTVIDEARLSRGRDRYLADIADIRTALRAGETYEVTLTDQLTVPDTEAAPPTRETSEATLTDRPAAGLAVYRGLRRANPAPYAAFLRFGEMVVACSSPERFLKVGRDRSVESKPIKGTAPRGADAEADESLRRALVLDPKTRAENLMIVDLLRNDLGRVCELGSVYVPELMAVETYATLHQLVSTVRGRRRPEVGVIDCVRACFPGGSMTGAPKLRTMEIIDRLETEARGIYSGTIGFLGLGGTADLNIVIRTAVHHEGRWRIGAGGAVVLDSEAAAEFDEMVLKAAAPLRAVRGQVSQAPTGGGIQPGSRPNQPASRS
ncbi:aminodeoxychorismate synthase component I [Nocardia sp. BMG111209]|uniref:aminodeoxychorismate synthase component I n=1 Tax=Nocardia sp. BMG111209 TaxID=1160137 RepID=UPI0003782DE9|nr:aminodeoxychorismate synthase component I [Nocardia sp. BMG111209]